MKNLKKKTLSQCTQLPRKAPIWPVYLDICEPYQYNTPAEIKTYAMQEKSNNYLTLNLPHVTLVILAVCPKTAQIFSPLTGGVFNSRFIKFLFNWQYTRVSHFLEETLFYLAVKELQL